MDKDQYKDPKWQKKRLEILERDDWTCVSCNESSKTLHVHHIFYIKNAKIWDYPDKLLFTLCEDCHKIEHLVYWKGGLLQNLRKYLNVHGFIGKKLETLILILGEVNPESGEWPATEVMNQLMRMVENNVENYIK